MKSNLVLASTAAASLLLLLLLLPPLSAATCTNFQCLMDIRDPNRLDSECRRLLPRKSYCYCCGGVERYLEFGPVCRRYCRKITRREGPISEPCRPMDNAPMETAVSSDSISASNPDFLSFPRYPTIRPLDQIVCDSRNGGAGFPPPVQQAEEEEEDEDGDEGSVDYWGADDEEIERQLREQERQQQLQEESGDDLGVRGGLSDIMGGSPEEPSNRMFHAFLPGFTQRIPRRFLTPRQKSRTQRRGRRARRTHQRD